jgi:2-methylisocitrate lyase-like PEP mutase family enzyme
MGKELEELGVKRLSFGNALFDKAIELLERDTARIVELSDTSHLYMGSKT